MLQTIRNGFLLLRCTIAMVVLTACLGVDFIHEHAQAISCSGQTFKLRTGPFLDRANQPESLICHACMFTSIFLQDGVFSFRHTTFAAAAGIFSTIAELLPAFPCSLIPGLRAPPLYSPF